MSTIAVAAMGFLLMWSDVAARHTVDLQTDQRTSPAQAPSLPDGWPASGITVTDDASIGTLRESLIEQIWGREGLPTRTAVSVTTDVGVSAMRSPVPLPNVRSVDRYRIQTYGQLLEPWLIRPTVASGALSLVVLGHNPTGVMAEGSTVPSLVAEALSRGHHVILVPMPMGGTKGHDILGRQAYEGFSPLQYFLDTPIVALNTFLAQNAPPTSITAMGVSGGGWTVTLFAALDPRIGHSVQIAGTLPLPLRSSHINEAGDWEQRLPGLTAAGTQLDYLDLYLMGVDGGRTQLQINNEFDTCCFSGTKDSEYAKHLTARNPRWTFERVARRGVHGIPDASVGELVGPRLGPELVKRPISYTRIIDDEDRGFSKSGPEWRERTGRRGAYNGDDWSPAGEAPCLEGGTGRHEATWTFTGVPDGPVTVSVSYQASPDLAPDVPFEIRGGDGVTLWSGNVNQQLAPARGATIRGVRFHELASVQTASGTVIVWQSDRAGGCVVADSARVTTH